eukprot:381934-Prorocentrum_minimum.AAC.1
MLFAAQGGQEVKIAALRVQCRLQPLPEPSDRRRQAAKGRQIHQSVRHRRAEPEVLAPAGAKR